MIKYCGKFVTFIQYMPKKPIKHGIKVYALCCAYTGYLITFEIYTGKEGTRDNSAIAVVIRLLFMAGIFPIAGNVIKCTGRVLYTDNFYTILALIQTVYQTFGMLTVGTISLTKKLSRTAADFPFHKYSNPITRGLPRGWTRFAYQKIFSKAKHIYTVQATIWKDRKMVGFLHNHMVKSSEEHKVRRWCGRSKRHKEIPAHEVVTDYNLYMGGVDAKDKDTADWSVSLKSLRFYLRFFH